MKGRGDWGGEEERELYMRRIAGHEEEIEK